MGAFNFSKSFNDGIDYERNGVVVKGLLTGSSSYATGGDTLDLKVKVGIKTVDDLLVEAGDILATTAGYSLKLDRTAPGAPKILVYSAGAQVANATNLSAVTWRVRLRGRQ